MFQYFRTHMKTIMMAVAVVFAATMFYGLGYRGLKNIGEKKTGIATINGREIDKVRLDSSYTSLVQRMPGRKTPQQTAYFQMLALNQVIEYTLMLNGARKNVRVSGGEVDGAIAQLMQANNIPNKQAFEEALRRNNFMPGQFRDMVKEDILIQKMIAKVTGSVTITPDDLREIRAAHILISPKVAVPTVEADRKKLLGQADKDAMALAGQVLDRVKKGESFSALAKRYSDDPGSRDKGGDLGYITTGMMVPEFEKTAFALKPGETSGIVKTPFGYHIIKLLDARLRKVPESEKGKDIREVILREKQGQAFNQWKMSLWQKAKIEIISPVFKAYDYRMKGQIDQAIAEYNAAIADSPNDPGPHLFLGDTYMQKGDVLMAIAEYVRATSLASSDPDICIVLGNAYEQAGTLKISKTVDYRTLALEQFKKASLLAGENKDIHNEIAEIYKKMGYSSLENGERARVVQIEKKEKFEEEIKKKAEEQKKP